MSMRESNMSATDISTSRVFHDEITTRSSHINNGNVAYLSTQDGSKNGGQLNHSATTLHCIGTDHLSSSETHCRDYEKVTPLIRCFSDVNLVQFCYKCECCRSSQHTKENSTEPKLILKQRQCTSRWDRMDSIGMNFVLAHGRLSGFNQLQKAENFKSPRRSDSSRGSRPGHPDISMFSRLNTTPVVVIATDNRLSARTDGCFQSHQTSPHTQKSYRQIAHSNPSINCSVHENHNRVNEDNSTGEIQADDNQLNHQNLKRRRHALNMARNEMCARNLGYRLGRRKELFEKRRRVAIYSLSFALSGLLLMILEMELTMAAVYDKNSLYSILIKSLLTTSTILLVASVIAYNILEIKLSTFDDSIEDWRIALTKEKLFHLCLEIIVCAIHPPPFHLTFKWRTYKVAKSEWSEVEASTDLFLSIPMFLRIYLLFRVMILLSPLLTDAGSRSIGAMNKINFNTQFIIKTFMTLCPGRVVVGVIVSMWFICSWTMRACERVHDSNHSNILNSMWLIAVTFLSIGYGDMVPHTYCGKSIAIFAGVMGSGCTALLVAVFARKLELSRAETHVIHFMMENQLSKRIENYAANVLRETWLIYKYTKLVRRVMPQRVRRHQKKFLRAIHGMRQTKVEQRKLKDSASSLVDLNKTQNHILDTLNNIKMEQSLLRNKLDVIDQALKHIQNEISSLPESLSCVR